MRRFVVAISSVLAQFGGAMRNEMDPGQQGFAQVPVFAMVVVVTIVMMLSNILERRFTRWQVIPIPSAKPLRAGHAP